MHCVTAMTRHLAQIRNMRMSFSNKGIILFEEKDSGVFLHVMLHPQVSACHVDYSSKILCIPIVSVFGDNFSPHDWEVFAQSRCKKSEHLESSPDLPAISQKHSDLIDLIKLPKDTNKYPNILVQVKAYRINKGFISKVKRGPTQRAMLVRDNLLEDI